MTNTKISPKSYINKVVYDKVEFKVSKRKKISSDDFFVPKFNQYNLLEENNYNVKQLKEIARHYGEKKTGNKTEMLHRIYNFLKYSNFAVIIQKNIRGFLRRSFNMSQGPALIDRKCVNDTDFLSLTELSDIESKNFFSILDDDGFVYGFDAKSFYNLTINKSGDVISGVKNPYNRKLFSEKNIQQFLKYIRLGTALNNGIEIKIEKKTTPRTVEQRIDLMTQRIFHKIDEFGHITDTRWFSELNRTQLVRFIRELVDIWEYRALLSTNTQRAICPPHGNPFIGLGVNTVINTFNIHLIKINILNVLENFIFRSPNRNDQSLGAFYVLGALTLVSGGAASSMPWLYESFKHSSGGGAGGTGGAGVASGAGGTGAGGAGGTGAGGAGGTGIGGSGETGGMGGITII